MGVLILIICIYVISSLIGAYLDYKKIKKLQQRILELEQSLKHLEKNTM